MGLTNFVLTVAGVTAAVLLLRSDVKQSATIFRRNVRQIRQWLEEESVAASKYENFFSFDCVLFLILECFKKMLVNVGWLVFYVGDVFCVEFFGFLWKFMPLVEEFNMV